MKLIVLLAVLCAVTFVVLAEKNAKSKTGKQAQNKKANSKTNNKAAKSKSGQKNAKKNSAKHSGKTGGGANADYYYYDGSEGEDTYLQSPDDYRGGKKNYRGWSSSEYDDDDSITVYDDMNYDEDYPYFNYYINRPQIMWAFFFPIYPTYGPYGGSYMLGGYGSPILAGAMLPLGRPPGPPLFNSGPQYGPPDYSGYADPSFNQKRIKSGEVKPDPKTKTADATPKKSNPAPAQTKQNDKKSVAENKSNKKGGAEKKKDTKKKDQKNKNTTG